MTKLVINGQTIDLDDSGISYVIEEYDTTVGNCNWHVRKYNNGYVEFQGEATLNNVNVDTEWYSLFSLAASKVGVFTYPSPLVKKYTEMANIRVAKLTSGGGIGSWLYTHYTSGTLEHTESYGIASVAKFTNMTIILNFQVTGLWKDDSNTVLRLPDVEYAFGSTAEMI